LLDDVDYVGTTADCWTAHHKAYLGMTLHWINKETRAREHAVLACRRLRGSHTFDILADAMTDTHSKFGVQDKVRRTTTDNASNFSKAFTQFGKAAASLPEVEVPREPADPELEVPEPFVEEAEEDPEYLAVENVLDEEVDASILPVHMRCAAHTLNLVATSDADKALEDDTFQTAANSAMKKARQLWNAQSRSVGNDDLILEELKRRLVVPNATRWNSIYDAIVVLNSIIGDEKTRQVFF
jgi:hypothetical protein